MKRALVFSLLLSLAIGTVSFGMTVDEALALFPPKSDILIPYSASGQAALETVIRTFEDALGVTPAFDKTSEEAYTALAVDPAHKDWLNKLSQCYYTLGDVFLRNQEGAATAFEKGRLWGIKSLRMNPEFAQEEIRHGFIAAVNQETDEAALYWTYANWARKDDFDKLGAIVRNDPPKLLALADRALAVDPTYVAYGPYRALAAFWGGLPPLPLYKFGQNLPRTLSYICAVIDEPGYCSACADCPIDSDPNAYFENRLIFAQYYLMEKSAWNDAARVLRSILDDPIGDTYPLYNAYDQEIAKDLLAEVDKHL
jgi:hypothetical protein